jgi:hypothetical protein
LRLTSIIGVKPGILQEKIQAEGKGKRKGGSVRAQIPVRAGSWRNASQTGILQACFTKKGRVSKIILIPGLDSVFFVFNVSNRMRMFPGKRSWRLFRLRGKTLSSNIRHTRHRAGLR